MTDTILDIPESITDAGTEFSWSVWTEDTVLHLCNVPWNNDYRDIVRFPTQDALDDYIDGSPNLPIHDLSYLPFQRNVLIPTPFNAANRYNYVRAKNSLAPIPGDQQRTYYYFILDAQYVAAGTTQLTLQLDVWQTFGYDVTFGPCYVERGHIGIANQNAFAHYGRDYLTMPEGLDTGSEYRTVHVTSRKIMDNPGDGDNYHILVTSTVDLTQSLDKFGSHDDPHVVAARGTQFQGMPSGANIYVFKTVQDFTDWLLSMQAYSWVVQGIVSVTLIPKVTRYFGDDDDLLTNANPDGLPDFFNVPSGRPTRLDTALSTNWRDSSFLTNILGARYAGLKKFLTSPYLVIELTAWNGSPVLIKPESWQDPDATIGELANLFPAGQRIALWPRGYNADGETQVTSPNADPVGNDDLGDFLDIAKIIDNFPSLPIVSNNAGLWIAQNRNTLGFQFAQANWSQQRALAGAQAGADVANTGIRNMGMQSGIFNRADQQTVTNSTTAQMQSAAIGGAAQMLGGSSEGGVGLAMGAMQGVAGIVNAAISSNAQLANSLVGQEARGASAIANMQQAGAVRDTNLGYAQFAARGDYAMQNQGINARVQDSMMAQPSTQGQYGGDPFNIVNNYLGFSLRFKMLNLQTMRAIGDFWLRYGYAIHQYLTIPSNLMVMSKFTYWKLSETYLPSAPMPETFKQTIRGIFEKGVTVWADPSYIGNTDWADNTPVNGISY